jgi:hypothetical protein
MVALTLPVWGKRAAPRNTIQTGAFPPFDAEPAQVLEHRRRVIGTCPLCVQIFVAQ